MAAKAFEGKATRQLELKPEYKDEQLQFQRLTLGKPNNGKRTKTILLLGATGEGKSTMINAMANFLLETKYETEYRFRLVDEGQNMDLDLTVSQTTWITDYVLYHQKSFPDEFPCNLRIIDTPGFGDTRGLKLDEQTVRILKKLFGREPPEGIDSVDIVGLVVKSSNVRLTHGLKYVIHSILSLFGSNVKDNFVIFATFSDGQKAAILTPLKKEGVPYKVVFKLDNGVLFPEIDDDDDDDDTMHASVWKRNEKQFKKFLLHMYEIFPVSLTLTREVLVQRKRLEEKLDSLQRKFQEKLAMIESQKSFQQALEFFEETMEENEQHSVNVISLINERFDIDSRALNCDNCESTCHWPCKVPLNVLARTCEVISRGKCTICECSVSAHNVYKHRLESKLITACVTANDIKAKYDFAATGALLTQLVIEKLQDDIDHNKDELDQMFEEARESMNCLNRISLKPTLLSRSAYIEHLIGLEEAGESPGWESRVEELNSMLEVARPRSAWRRDLVEPADDSDD